MDFYKLPSIHTYNTCKKNNIYYIHIIMYIHISLGGWEDYQESLYQILQVCKDCCEREIRESITVMMCEGSICPRIVVTQFTVPVIRGY